MTNTLLFVPDGDELDLEAIWANKSVEKLRHVRHHQVKSSRRSRRHMVGLSKRGLKAIRRRKARRAERKLELRELRDREMFRHDAAIVAYEPEQASTIVIHRIEVYGQPEQTHYHVIDDDAADMGTIIKLVDAQDCHCTGFREFGIDD